MKKTICLAIVLALLFVAAGPVFADRLGELEKQFEALQQRKQQILDEAQRIDVELNRLQGRFAERRLAIEEIGKKEEAKPAEKIEIPEPAEKVE